MAAHYEPNEKVVSDTQHCPVVEVEKPSGKHEEYVVDAEGKPVRIDYSGAHKKTDPEEIKYVTPWPAMPKSVYLWPRLTQARIQARQEA